MTQFEFDFQFQDFPYTADCQVFPIDGSTELHVTPLDSRILENFGTRVLTLTSDGSITAAVPEPSEERDYVLALAEGLSNYFGNETSRKDW